MYYINKNYVEKKNNLLQNIVINKTIDIRVTNILFK